MVMYCGNIVEQGTVFEIFENEASVYDWAHAIFARTDRSQSATLRSHQRYGSELV